MTRNVQSDRILVRGDLAGHCSEARNVADAVAVLDVLDVFEIAEDPLLQVIGLASVVPDDGADARWNADDLAVEDERVALVAEPTC